MTKIYHIWLGFWYWLTDNQHVKNMAEQRMWWCYKRPEWHGDKMRIGCDSRNGNLCGECGCVLKFKTRVKEEACPLGKW